MECDTLIVGGGIAGMESALTLGDMGFKVLLVEKEPSIGGKMILLSKVFPTLDCASCISTPKMAATSHHPNVTVLTSAEVAGIERGNDGSFLARVRRKPTFVDPAACTGCGECERRCTVPVPDRFNFDLVATRAIHIAFPQAVPKKAVIESAGSSPCSFRCPAGVQAHGYVSLVRSGRYDEAFRLHLEDAPLPGVLSRACYAPCEDDCTRASVEGKVSIRGIKRFLVDQYYMRHPEPEYGAPVAKTGRSVAVIGSGPAGLAASFFLARRGHAVTIFEAAPEPGGMLRCGIPPFRLPRGVLDRDIRNVTALGVEIRTRTPVYSALGLKSRGFDAVFLAVGTMEPQELDLPGRNLEGVIDAMKFLGAANRAEMNLARKRVAVIGGGNVAIDSARMALRCGAEHVCIYYRRSRAEMPAHAWEIDAALAEGVELRELAVPIRFLGQDRRLRCIEVLSTKLGSPDAKGRRSPEPIPGSEKNHDAGVAVLAIGLRPSTSAFAGELSRNRDETLIVDPETLATSTPGVFAGGDAVTGPSMIIQAIAQGKRAAFHIDRALRGEREATLFDSRAPMVEQDHVLARGGPTPRPSIALRELSPASRARSTAEIEATPTEEEARASAARCLDCGVCANCRECVTTCPAGAIRFDMRAVETTVHARSALVATGFRLFDARRKPALGYDRFPNVVTAMQMDRLLAPTRPYNALVRPSDGKVPSSVGYVLCTGSRDCTVDNRLCSRVCCMYSVKQAQLILGALPIAEVTIYYVDIRAFGKGYEEFYEQAKGMGVHFVKGRVAKVEQTDEDDLLVRFEDIAGGSGAKQARHDLVVLSVGLTANPDPVGLMKSLNLEADPSSYVREIDEDLQPGRTTTDGIFVAGTAAGIRDIPDTILHAGAAAAQVAAFLRKPGATR